MPTDLKHFTPQQLIEKYCVDDSFRDELNRGVFWQEGKETLAFYPVDGLEGSVLWSVIAAAGLSLSSLPMAMASVPTVLLDLGASTIDYCTKRKKGKKAKEPQVKSPHFIIDVKSSDFINLDDPLPYSFSEALILLMKFRRETNESLAEACNLSSKTISRLRNRETDPSKENVVALCIGLNLDPYIGHQLLDRAGRSLSGDEVGRAYDFLMGIAMGIDINEANEMLKRMNLPILGNEQ